MSMTESEALGMLRAKLTCMELEDLACIEKGCDKDCDNCNYCYEQGNRGQSKEALAIAIKSLSEIQQYRAIGTVKGYERAIQISIENYNLCREYKAKVQEFEAIGTVSEFRELKEKATAKRKCPNCNELLNPEYRFCPTCRRKVDWSEGKE